MLYTYCILEHLVKVIELHFYSSGVEDLALPIFLSLPMVRVEARDMCSRRQY